MKHLLSLQISLLYLIWIAYTDFVLWLEAHLLSCPIKQMTGVDCPGCGMQRAFIFLLKGNLLESLKTHAAVVPMIMMLVFLPFHVKYEFKNGTKVLVYLFIISAALTVIQYAYKIFSGGLV